LTAALLQRGHFVRSFDRPRIMAPPDDNHPAENLEFVEGDFTCEADVKQALLGCEVCFHLISTTLPKSSIADPVFDIETNLMGSLRLLDHAVRQGLRKIIFLSSGGTVYGLPLRLPISEDHPTNPTCSYGIIKLAIEKYLGLYHHLYGLDFCVLRLSNPFGERQRTKGSQGAVTVFLGKALRGEPIEIWGDGSVVRDYMHISDTVRAILLAMDYEGDTRVMNIGSGCGSSLNEVLDAISQVLGRQVDRTYIKARSFDVPANILAIDRARASLGWSPQVSFIDGLKRTAEWLRAHPDW
jgi:UDP-glucose 4-epimerase